jgi:predicted transposase/invertase (TIGR01784 family)
MAGVFINPKTDFAFKKIFGSQESKDILISFLNTIVYESQPIVTDLTIVDPYQSPQIPREKTSYLDVKAILNNGKRVLIEMQVLNVLGFTQRILYNATKAFATQLQSGEDYSQLTSVIALTITDFKLFSESDEAISRYRLKERDSLRDYSDDLELIFVELPKFTKELDSLVDDLDKWIFFLKSASQLNDIPANMATVPAIDRAFSIAQQSRLDREELEIFEKQQMFVRDNINGRLFAKQEGIQEGKIEVARSLLDLLDIETIAQRTGLSIEEVRNLQSDRITEG